MGLNTSARANRPCGDRSPTNLRAFNNVKRLDAPFRELVGTSFALRKVIQLIETVAPGDSTALLQGEKGTGKELIARAIHNRSPRRARSFVIENVIERSAIVSRGSTLEVSLQDLNTRLRHGYGAEKSQTLEEVERNHILATLKQTGWVVSGLKGAAARLGLNRSTLHFRMKTLGIARGFNASLDQARNEIVISPFETA